MRPRAIGLAALLAGAPLWAAADSGAQGQDIAEAFLRGEFAGIWRAMTPEMQAAIGSEAALTGVRTELEQTFGQEVEVLSEETVRQGPHDVYQRIARWSTSPVPLSLVVALDADDRIAGLRVQPLPTAADSPHLDYQTRAALHLPVEGAWHVYWGGREVADNYHAADPGQRFAMDLLVLEAGQSHTGDPAVLASYHCWDRPILAPADGTVALSVADLPDQAIGSADPANPAGNHVVIDFGGGEFGFLAHLRQGSVTVAAGEQVTRGQEIGRCGNSGNTSEPHLHFHLQTSALLGQGEGLPAQFLDYVADGEPVARGEPARGQTIAPGE